jgi:uncharacterized protein
MNIEELRSSGRIILEYVRGSQLYGTATPESDTDIGGIFIVPAEDWVSMVHPPNEISDSKGDTTFYELKRYLELASACNPSIIEAMYLPDDCIRHIRVPMGRLINNRQIFMTKKALHSFSGYAFQQIKRASGQNKKVNSVKKLVNKTGMEMLRYSIVQGEISLEAIRRHTNDNFLKYVMKGVKDYPKDAMVFSNTIEKNTFSHPCVKCMMKPTREQYFWCVEGDIGKNPYFQFHIVSQNKDWGELPLNKYMPFRPKKIECLDGYDISAVEHIHGLYRLYKNGAGIKFNNDEPSCVSIPEDREWKDYIGVIYYNENGYKKDCAEWESFWEWMGNRNEERWNTDWQKSAKYDTKNMMHTVRLLLSAENIAKNGEPIIRFTGDNLTFLKDIRSGSFEYDYIFKYAQDMEIELKELFEKSSLPWGCDMNYVNSLYKNMLNEF